MEIYEEGAREYLNAMREREIPSNGPQLLPNLS